MPEASRSQQHVFVLNLSLSMKCPGGLVGFTGNPCDLGSDQTFTIFGLHVPLSL